MKPSKDEITKELEQLRELRPKIRKKTAFGDDNVAAISAQILVLETDMDDDEIYETWEHNEHTLDNALYARSWLDGEALDGGLAENWQTLVK